MNIAALFKAVDAIVAVRDAARRFRRTEPESPEPPPPPSSVVSSLPGQIEAKLTGVVIAALKEAFERDHARLELERAQMEEARRRTEQALRLERQRQAADRELARLRLLAGAAMIAWVVSVALTAAGRAGDSVPGIVALIVGWVLMLGSFAASFLAQGRVGALVRDDEDAGSPTAGAILSLWLLILGLAVTAVSLLV
jgi:hypothetical protein